MRSSFLRRLLKDTRANTLMIGAASIFPLVGLIGGGVDASRLYLTKARLQQACDSATLAARKQLGGDAMANGEIPGSIVTTANNYFDNNFIDGMYGSEDAEFEIEAGSTTRIDGTATVDVPMMMMSVFGFEQTELNVACSAELNLPNIDVMLVLDTSGSMDFPTESGTRMDGLRDAVFTFYDEVMAVKPDESQLRIGVVPYNSAVNVGAVLRAENPDFIADSHTYQSRRPIHRPVSNNDGVDEGDVISSTTAVELLPTDSNFSGPPDRLGSSNQTYYRWDRNSSTQQNYCRYSYAGSYMVAGKRWVISNVSWNSGYWGSNTAASQRAACIGTVRKETLAGPADVRPPTYRHEFYYYRYEPITYDTSAFKMGTTVGLPTGTNGANVNSTWNGCIEERAPIIPTSGTTPVDGALDLDIDTVPNASDPDTQWKPQWFQATYSRSTVAGQNVSVENLNWYPTTFGRESYDCPAAAVRLQEWPTNGGSRNAAFETYINNLTALGGTIHDGGMVWGARFISPTGIFADDNETAQNGEPISRHLIFMTDGEMAPPVSHYTSFGNYNLDGRFFGFADGGWTQESLAPYHNSRLAAICEEVKNKNITVWTITFGLEQNGFTRACATGPQRAYEAANSASLVAAFRQIATSIAELRLVQ